VGIAILYSETKQKHRIN